MNTIKFNARNTLVIAHRGLSGLETENTCAAFVAAGNRSHYGIETDIRRAGDGSLIIVHDEDTARIARDTVNVKAESYETLRNLVLLDTDGKSERADLRLPSLEEYISICKKYEKTAILELKPHFTDDEIAEIISRIEAMGYMDNVIFIAFFYDNLCRVRAIRPSQPCQFLFREIDDNGIDQLVADKIDVDCAYGWLTKERVDHLHALGLKINCWTVDNKQDAEQLAQWGVDYITSNILEAQK